MVALLVNFENWLEAGQLSLVESLLDLGGKKHLNIQENNKKDEDN